jgi:hypothetical protein
MEMAQFGLTPEDCKHHANNKTDLLVIDLRAGGMKNSEPLESD